MKLTVDNIKNILEKEYGWFHLDSESPNVINVFIDELIKDTLKIIDDKNKLNKNT